MDDYPQNPGHFKPIPGKIPLAFKMQAIFVKKLGGILATLREKRRPRSSIVFSHNENICQQK